VISTLSGIPAGRSVDRLGGAKILVVGVILMIMGSLALSVLPAMYGISGYIAGIAILTPGYQLFQAANSTIVMIDVPADERGVVSGMLGLSRNLGLITGASVMGAIFALSTATSDFKAANPDAVARGMGVTFLFAAGLLSIAAAMAVLTSLIARRKDMA
jgi:MFS family permease